MTRRTLSVAICLIVAASTIACGGAPATPGSPSVPSSSRGASAVLPSPDGPRGSDLPIAGGSWSSSTPMPSRRAEHAAAVIDGVIYLPGGLDGDGKTLDTFESYDPATDTWATLPPLPEPRDHFGLAALDGKLYLTGGSIFFEGAVRASTWAYDPAAATWTALAPMPAPRNQHGSLAIDGKIYVAGGVVRGPDSRALWAYDPATGEWQTDLAPMPTEREHLAVVGAGGRLIALGGRKGSNFAAVEAFDPATNTWESFPDMPTPRGGMTADVIDGVIHVAGGENLETMSTYSEHESSASRRRPGHAGPTSRRSATGWPLLSSMAAGT